MTIFPQPLFRAQRSYRVFFVIFVTILFLSIVGIRAWYASASQPPQAFPVDTDITIREGMNLTDVAAHLEATGVIDSQFIFQTIFSQKYEDKFVKAGTYRFSVPLDIHGVIEALVQGDYTSPLQKSVFPEGFRIAHFDDYFRPDSSETHNDIPQTLEGYLFPDTYFIEKTTTQTELIESMQKNYEVQIAPLRERIQNSGFTEKEIITLASILEREANDETSMRMVSGVLHNRLIINMPLQVDAVFEYILGKTSDELTEDDLLLDSPYNTYTHAGFPPTPISNPGIIAIEAALNPIEHNFLYYLTDAQGKFYYAKTFEEHKQNKARYLR